MQLIKSALRQLRLPESAFYKPNLRYDSIYGSVDISVIMVFTITDGGQVYSKYAGFKVMLKMSQIFTKFVTKF
jgi:hypothetical protein